MSTEKDGCCLLPNDWKSPEKMQTATWTSLYARTQLGSTEIIHITDIKQLCQTCFIEHRYFKIDLTVFTISKYLQCIEERANSEKLDLELCGVHHKKYMRMD